MSSPKSKFSSIHDAAQYVNDELHRHALLPASQKLRFRSTDEAALVPQLAGVNNDKLVINTIHKLLKTLKEAEQRTITVPESPKIRVSPRPTLLDTAKTQPAQSASKRVSKHTQASLRRYEVTVEQLRDRLRLEGPDLTWHTVPLKPDESQEEKSRDEARDEANTTSLLLQELLEHRELASKALQTVLLFVQASNSFLYTRCVHNCECAVPEPVKIPNITQKENNSELATTLDKLQELVDDWRDIAALL